MEELEVYGSQVKHIREATHFSTNKDCSQRNYVSIPLENLADFFCGYAGKIYNGVNPRVSEVSHTTSQLFFDFSFVFMKPEENLVTFLKDLEDDVYDYIEYFISVVQSEMETRFTLTKERSELVACVLRPVGDLFFHTNDKILTEMRCIFPYAFLSSEHTTDFLKLLKGSQRFLNEGERFTLPPLESIIASVKVGSMPLYGSTMKKKERCLKFSNSFGDMIFGREEKALSDVFYPQLHTLMKKGYLDPNFVDEHINNCGLEFWLPLFFSNGYFGETLYPKDDLVQIEAETEEEKFPSPKKPLDLARTYLDMMKPSRFESFWSWYDIGQALFSIDPVTGIDLWGEFSSETFREDCEVRWESFDDLHGQGKLMVTIDTLEFFAKEDSPLLYERRKNREIDDLMIKASSGQSHAKVAEAFKACFPFDYAYVSHAKKIWCTFNGVRWTKIDGDIDLRKRIRGDFTDKLNILKLKHDRLASKAKDRQVMAIHKNIASNLGSLISKLESEPFQNSVTNMLRSDYHKKDFLEWKDSEWAYFCCLNGVIDLRGENPVFRTGKPEDYTVRHGCKFPDSYNHNHPKVTEVMKYLREVFRSSELREFVLLLCASFLHSGNVNKLFTLFQGGGNNSKSVFVKLLTASFRKYFGKIAPEYFTEDKKDSKGPNPGLARVRGCKIVATEEPNKEAKFKEGTIKGLTGRDKRSDRDLYEAGGDCADEEPSFNIIFGVNDAPDITDTQDAIWNRILEISFTSRWIPRGDSYNVPSTYEEQLTKGVFIMDENFEQKIPSMAPALLWILFQKYSDYLEKGLVRPQEVLEATERYKRKNNHYLTFRDEKMDQVPDERVYLDDVYRVFVEWWTDSHLKGKVPTKESFFLEMQKESLLGPSEDRTWIGWHLEPMNLIGSSITTTSIKEELSIVEEVTLFLANHCEKVDDPKIKIPSRVLYKAFIDRGGSPSVTHLNFGISLGKILGRGKHVKDSNNKAYLGLRLKP